MTKAIILENGDLKIVRTDWKEIIERYINFKQWNNARYDYGEFYREVMPPFLYQVGIEEDQIEPCHDISAHGHLSNAPGFVKITEDEEGDREYEVMWWYPQYETKDPIEELLDKGEVIFKAV